MAVCVQCLSLIASVIVLREDSVALGYRGYLTAMSSLMVLNKAQVSFMVGLNAIVLTVIPMQ